MLSPLEEFVKLRLVKVEEEEGEDDVPIPFSLRRMIGQEYHIGPEGALIGVGPHCTVVLPVESGLAKEHCRIVWEEEEGEEGRGVRRGTQGHFVLQDLTGGEGALRLNSGSARMDQSDESSTVLMASPPPSIFLLTLTHGVRFSAGKMVCQLSALPPELERVAKAFHLARNRRLAELMEYVDSFDPPVMNIPALAVTEEEEEEEEGEGGRMLFFHPSALSDKKGFDVNAVYVPPSYKEEDSSFVFSGARRPVRQSILPTTPRPLLNQTSQLLLHIAIDNNDINMVKYLLDKGADVSNLQIRELLLMTLQEAIIGDFDIVTYIIIQSGPLP